MPYAVVCYFAKLQFRRLCSGTVRCLASSATKPRSNAVQSVSKNDHECLVVKWKDGTFDEYPYIYLRENCRCSTCYTNERKSRTMYSPKEVDINITADSAYWNTDKNHLEVSWTDGHTSEYTSEWLKYLRYKSNYVINFAYYEEAAYYL